MSSDEADSKTQDVLPSGTYQCNIVDGSIKEVKPGKKNTGKPYWNIQFVVQEGQFAGRSIYSTVMLFDGALYSLAQLMKALDIDVSAGTFQVPSLEELFGKSVAVRGQKKPAATDPETGRDIPERFEVKGYLKSKSGTPKTGDASLLP